MSTKLIMFSEDGTRKEFFLTEDVTTIGRKVDCDIRIPLPSVSRRHAEIVREDGGWVLRDLGAANGTYLNNRRITEDDLEPGDQIVIGSVIFTLQIDGEPPDDEIIEVRSTTQDRTATDRRNTISASRHVSVSDEDIDPIAALEALASSADQTAIDPDDDEDEA